jgi:ATP-dependent DNA helicase RecG
MDLVSGPPEMTFPRNVALMLFTEKPEKFFPYTHIEIVEFPNGAGDPEFNERPPLTGPVQQQITKVLDFFKTNILQEKIIKQHDKAEAIRIWNYPLEALEEAVANSIYHLNYQVFKPVEIRIYPDSIVILNYGGPDRSIKSDALNIGTVKPRRYRNRRLGDFLKELGLTEGKATGIPRIKKALKENGSSEPFFDFDEDCTFFEVDFYIHPSFRKTFDLVGQAPLIKTKTKLTTKSDIVKFFENEYNSELAIKRSKILFDLIPQVIEILNLAKTPQKRSELLNSTGLSNHTDNASRYVTPLVVADLLTMTIKGKPNSPQQKYYTTEKGKKLLVVISNS